jgi:[ribosomal protein S5]-alanine N-acetyltransferase
MPIKLDENSRVTAPDRLITRRLVLRKPVLDDAAPVLATYAGDPVVTRFLTWSADQTVEEIRLFLKRALEKWEAKNVFTWTITLAETGQPIGMIDLRLETHAQLGYVLARSHWNRGIMTEAVRAVIDWALSQPGIHRVWAVCDVDNGASARVMEKAGMEREGLFRKYMVFPNLGPAPRDCFCYARVRPG